MICSGLVLTALAFLAAWPLQRAAGGEAGTAFVLAQHPLAAALALCGATVVGGTIAWTLARMVTPLTGLAVLGAGMGWAALDLNTMAPVIADGHAASLVVDGLFWAIAILIISWLAFRDAPPYPQVAAHQGEGGPTDPLLSPDAVRILAVGLAALPIAWIFAVTEWRGQTLMATTLGGYVAGLLVRFVAPGVTPVLLPVGVMLAGTLAGWTSAVFDLPDAVAHVWATNSVPRLLLPLPIDWAAGALLGCAVGYRAFWSLDEAQQSPPMDAGNYQPST